MSLTRTLSSELIPRGIRVNATAAIQSQVPARRFGDPAEIARAVVFLASDEWAFTVGSELLIDGGLSL